MEKEITLKSDELLEYIKENVETYDLLEISYNRIYAPGEVLDIEFDDEYGDEIFEITLQLTGELLNDTIKIDMLELKDDIIEIIHTKDKRSTVIVVEA
ncbi:MAG: DUF2097 domain-containing protein [Methanobacteriaceae archaeon]|jgi:hypothetical protein|nr:MAG: hypothetical protein CIT01_06300 [Methanobacterium sp. BRmetb2]MCC7558314.1 DUF2097 domain-containing protein [Methanobacteriaceae archaeon]